MRLQLTFLEAVKGCSKDIDVPHVGRDGRVARGAGLRQVEVRVPAGIREGMTLRLAGKGADGDAGAPKGNLMVQVEVAREEYFTRDGDDVHVELPLTPAQAALGGPFDVLTVDGVVELRVPAGAQSGARLALRGRGAPKLNGGGARGSHYVHVNVVTPRELSARARELYEELQALDEREGADSEEHATFRRRMARAAGRLRAHEADEDANAA